MNIDNKIRNLPIICDWCTYNGEVYFASINYGESVKRNKPVFDLAYCATKSMNGIFLKQVVYNKNLQKKIM